MRDDLEIPPPGYRVGHRPARLDPATRRLAMIAAGIGGALVVLVGVWSMAGGGSTPGIPVVSAPPGPMRVKPANPGGMQVAGVSERILGGNGRQSGTAALAPPPETPDLSALQSPPAAPPATPATNPTPMAGRAATPPATETKNGLPLPPPAPPPLRLATQATSAPPPPGAGAGSATEVQLAAMSSEQAAKREWQRLQAALPDMLSSRQPLVEKVQVDGHTFWRLRTGGFADIAEATQFCQALRAKGNDCTIAAF